MIGGCDHEEVHFTFVSRVPEGILSGFVESVWYARGCIDYRRERIAPTGSCVAVLVLGPPIIETPSNGAGRSFVATTGFMIGPHDGPVVNEPTGETYAIGIVTTPVGCRSVFGCDPAALRGTVVDLADAWPAMRTIRDRLERVSEPGAMLDLLERELAERIDVALPGVDRCAAAVAVLDAEPTISIRELAARIGVTHGFLDREFLRIVGLTPRALARITRLRRVLAQVDVFGDVHWTRLAIQFGWFDQSHFIRDFKRHTGVTPSAYVRMQRAVFAPADASPGFVPER